MREIVTLQCPVCKERNYSTTKNKKTTTGRLEFTKFCNRCRKHTATKKRSSSVRQSALRTLLVRRSMASETTGA